MSPMSDPSGMGGLGSSLLKPDFLLLAYLAVWYFGNYKSNIRFEPPHLLEYQRVNHFAVNCAIFVFICVILVHTTELIMLCVIRSCVCDTITPPANRQPLAYLGRQRPSGFHSGNT